MRKARNSKRERTHEEEEKEKGEEDLCFEKED